MSQLTATSQRTVPLTIARRHSFRTTVRILLLTALAPVLSLGAGPLHQDGEPYGSGRTGAIQPETGTRIEIGPDSAPNVVLIVIDTLRADHVGCYGARRKTPALDQLAEEGVRFERAYATASWTLPSVCSIMTGMYPTSHSVTGTGRRLPEEVVTLAEVLHQNGYATAAVVSHRMLSRASGLQQGFQRYFMEVTGNPHATISSDAVLRKARQLLRRLGNQPRPFFLFLHFFDPHWEYMDHADIDYIDSSVTPVPRFAAFSRARAEMMDPSRDIVARVQDLYDEEIRHTDDCVGRLLDMLRADRLMDNTVVVVTSDHGEEFMDHGGAGHGRTLYSEVVRVPLLMRLPRGHGAQLINTPVSLASLFPAILNLCGLPTGVCLPQNPLPQETLLSARGEGTPILSEIGPRGTYKQAIVLDNLVLIVDKKTHRMELYNLAADPRETIDLCNRSQRIAADLYERLSELLSSAQSLAPYPRPRKFSDGERDQLRILGYADP